jgi:hypothetical protein
LVAMRGWVSMHAIAEALCTFALRSGGHDNITVAVLRMGSPITSWNRNSERVPKAEASLEPNAAVEASGNGEADASNSSVVSVLAQQSTNVTLDPLVVGSEPEATARSTAQSTAKSTAQSIVIHGAVQADTQQGDNQ